MMDEKGMESENCFFPSIIQPEPKCVDFVCELVVEGRAWEPGGHELTVFLLFKEIVRLPTLLRQQCWELLRACWQWCAKGCNNSQQQCWGLQCIVGRIQPISLFNLCVIRERGPNSVGRAKQTDPTLLRYASAITEQKKCWELSAEKFDLFQTLRNNIQQHATGCTNGRNM